MGAGGMSSEGPLWGGTNSLCCHHKAQVLFFARPFLQPKPLWPEETEQKIFGSPPLLPPKPHDCQSSLGIATAEGIT